MIIPNFIFYNISLATEVVFMFWQRCNIVSLTMCILISYLIYTLSNAQTFLMNGDFIDIIKCFFLLSIRYSFHFLLKQFKTVGKPTIHFKIKICFICLKLDLIVLQSNHSNIIQCLTIAFQKALSHI